ncbi:MAG: hypothetical protein R2865_02775 [Deinococcales bacterium]
MLKAHGIAKGDRVAIYMPMIPEAVIAVSLCPYRATHSIAFGGLVLQPLADRINDASTKR